MTDTTTRTTSDDANAPAEQPLEEGLAQAYRTLAMVYLEPPTEELTASFREWRGALDEPGLPDELREAIEIVANADTDPDELRPVYTRLFHGLSRNHSPPPPYESVYRDGRLQGPHSVLVERAYAEAGLAFDDSPENVDHLGVELHFLAHLCEENGHEAQRSFVESHLLEWVPEFHEAAERCDAPEFYRGVFAITETLLRLQLAVLEE